MKVLVIGQGGREHALVWKISQSKKVKKIFALPGNAGMTELAEAVDIKASNIIEIADFAGGHRCFRADLHLYTGGCRLPGAGRVERRGAGRRGNKGFLHEIATVYA